MKYGESTFDLFYLLFAVSSGCLLLKKAKDRAGRLMGAAALILGLGDAFHLVPRVLDYFMEADMTAALGIGKLVTSITMTVFYVLLYYIWLDVYQEWGETRLNMTIVVWGLAVLRIILCLFPQNGWLRNEGELQWSYFRNVPFLILGLDLCWLYFTKRREDRCFRWMWLYILLSFLFYIPVVVGAKAVPMLGMLMLPKTICYILMIVAFLKKNRE